MNEIYIENYLINQINTNPFSYIFKTLFKGLKKNTKINIDLGLDLIKINIRDTINVSKLNEYFKEINSFSEYYSYLTNNQIVNSFDSVLLYAKKYEIIINSKEESKIYKYSRYINDLDQLITTNYCVNQVVSDNSYTIQFKYIYSNKLKLELLRYFNYCQLNLEINNIHESFDDQKFVKEYSFIGSNWALLSQVYKCKDFLEGKSLIYLIDNIPYLFSYHDLFYFIERLNDYESFLKFSPIIKHLVDNNSQSFFIKINKNKVDYNPIDKNSLLFNKKTMQSIIKGFIKCISELENLYKLDCVYNTSYLKAHKNFNAKYYFLNKKETTWKKENIELKNLKFFNCDIDKLNIKAYYSYNSSSNVIYNYNVDYLGNGNIKGNNIYIFVNNTNKKSVKKHILSYLSNIKKDIHKDRFIIVIKTHECLFKWVLNEIEIVYVSDLEKLEKDNKKSIRQLTSKEETKIYNRVYKKEYSTNSNSFNIFCKKELVYKYPKEKCYYIESKYFKPGNNICLFDSNSNINYYKFNENLINYLKTKELNNATLILVDRITSTYKESNNWYNLVSIIERDILKYSSIYEKLKTALFLSSSLSNFSYFTILNNDNIINNYYLLIYNLYDSCKNYINDNKEAVELFNLIDPSFCSISCSILYNKNYHNFIPAKNNVPIKNKEKLLSVIFAFLNNFSLLSYYINHNTNSIEEERNKVEYNSNFIKYINLLSKDHDKLIKSLFENNIEIFNLFNITI